MLSLCDWPHEDGWQRHEYEKVPNLKHISRTEILHSPTKWLLFPNEVTNCISMAQKCWVVSQYTFPTSLFQQSIQHIAGIPSFSVHSSIMYWMHCK